MTQEVKVTPSRFIVIGLASTVTGLSKRAIEGKIARGDWADGKQYRKGPDGRIYIDLHGYERWVEKGV
jgi:hypothetical protein